MVYVMNNGDNQDCVDNDSRNNNFDIYDDLSLLEFNRQGLPFYTPPIKYLCIGVSHLSFKVKR